MFPKSLAILIAEYIAPGQLKDWVRERAPRLRGKCLPTKGMRYDIKLVNDSANSDQHIIDIYDINYDSSTDDHEPDEYVNYPNNSPYITVDGNQMLAAEYGDCICCSFSDPSNISNVYLCANPRAETYMQGRWIFLNGISINPADWALDFLEKCLSSQYCIKLMCSNTNPRIIPLLKKVPFDKLDRSEITANPIMISWLRENQELIDDICNLIRNPAAESLVREIVNLDTFNNANIWSNPAPWAIEEMKKHTLPGRVLPDGTKIPLDFLISENSNDWVVDYVTSITDPELWTDREREGLYRNPNPRALKFVHDHPELFKLTPMIWSNPEIFELVPDPKIVAALESI